MGYYIRFLKDKSKRPNWKVQLVSYKKKDTTGSVAEKPAKVWTIERERWPVLGFSPQMTAEQLDPAHDN